MEYIPKIDEMSRRLFEFGGENLRRRARRKSPDLVKIGIVLGILMGLVISAEFAFNPRMTRRAISTRRRWWRLVCGHSTI